ncbi:DUF2207 domain-containing protein [Chryseobacterium balustinum]|uniref:Predicted membrane protein n=1 Tax=Chryseobacterium balustinum TaxID=246 RepID=A0AAX2IL03_9FLAO|nr:DUF2207 domain-containing protein [Chryseobacterium balustinum]AZB27985.1 DUF2207 domain-containing protein [Chryseobacterium balustinum]SKB55098.1 Predicted membrane protein [Chryseobacterium balustinum]SQA89794.1 Predicted membrane protein (DUF2207) [Chryseobacterium balustinum]
MKKLIAFLFLIFFSLSFAQDADGTVAVGEEQSGFLSGSERILSFHADIDVDKNSGLSITEKIKVHSLGENIKRGIFRSLPLVRNLNDRTQKVKYNIVSVKKDGVDEDFHEEIEDGYLKVYVGNKDVILTPGDYNYEIKYTTEKQIGFFEKYDELYWNVNGTEWNFPVDSISATVNLPQGAGILQNSCYKGAYGSTSKDCMAKVLSEHSIEWSAKDLGPGEGLTIAVGFKKGIMVPPPPPTFLEKFGILIGGIIIFLGLLFYYYSTWKKYGVDPEMPTIYPQFNSPDDLSPASLGFINSESFKNKYLTAALVNLAIKGYVQIVEDEDPGIFGLFKSKQFTVKKLKNPDQNLPKEEINLMNNLFSKNIVDSIKFDGKYDSKIEQAVRSFQSTLKFQHDTLLNEGNNSKKLILPILVILGVYFLGLFVSFTIFPEFEKVFLGIFILAILTVAFVIAIVLFKFYPGLFKIFLIFPVIALVLLGVLLYKGSDFTIDNNFNICYIFIVLGFMSLVIYQFLIKRPSEEKLRKKSLIKGFEMYMGAAENQQIKFHNPPEMTPQSFEKLLPFAMVLGVDEIWGKKFDDLLKKMSYEYQSNWYVGSSMNYFAMASVLNSSLTQSIQSSATQPSSSGSSSGSGSGGGGFSGGGGGGGGGGGW